jgi:hypothetical protein
MTDEKTEATPTPDEPSPKPAVPPPGQLDLDAARAAVRRGVWGGEGPPGERRRYAYSKM